MRSTSVMKPWTGALLVLRPPLAAQDRFAELARVVAAELEHSGTLGGSASDFVMVPDQHAAAIVFANRQSHLTRTVDAAVDAVLGLGPKPAPRPAEPIALTPDEIAEYVGRYSQGQGGPQEIVRTDGGGIALRTGGTLLPLTKIGTDAFTVQLPGFTDPIRIEFVRGPDGHVLFLHNRLRAQKRVQ